MSHGFGVGGGWVGTRKKISVVEARKILFSARVTHKSKIQKIVCVWKGTRSPLTKGENFGESSFVQYGTVCGYTRETGGASIFHLEYFLHAWIYSSWNG